MKRIITLALAAALTLSMAVSTAAVESKGANNATIKTTVAGVSTKAPVIDGKISEYEYKEITYTDADMYYSGSTDARLSTTKGLDLKMYASYDKDYMYVAVSIKNVDFIQEMDPVSNMWQQHSLQICAAKADEKTAATRTELGISKNTKTGKLVSTVWADGYKTNFKADDTGKDYQVSTDGGRIIYEMKVPAKMFGITEFKKGEQVGLTFCLNAGKSSSDRGVLEWGSGCANGKDSTKFAKVTLGDAIEIPKAPAASANTADFASIAVVALAMSAAAAVVVSKKH